MITAHKASGLLVLAAVLARLSLPLGRNRPTVGERWQRRLAGGVHRLILALLVLVPSAGWIFVSLAPQDRPLDYRGSDLVELPLPPDDAASFAWHEAHELAGFALLGLFALHFTGFAFHQLRPGESVLGPMLADSRAARRLALLALVLLGIWTVGLGLDLFDVRLWRSAP